MSDRIDVRVKAALTPSQLKSEPASALLERPAVRIALTVLVASLILFARRYAQMLDPQVWDEEGIIITDIVAHGPASIFMPLNGYLLIVSRCVSMIALFVPLREYPLVATFVTWAFIVLVATVIALVPSRLHGGPLLGLAVLLVPSDPEVFGVPLYTFWWTIPLLYACYFWESAPRIMWWRVAAIVVGGLSAPIIIVAWPVFAMSALRKRNAPNIAAASAALLCAIVQVIEVAHATPITHLTLKSIVPAIQKLGGGYLVWNLASVGRHTICLIGGFATIAFVAIAVWRERPMRGILCVLAYLWIASALSSSSRVDINITDQVVAGARYYFVPFFVEGWILLQIALGARVAKLRVIAIALLVCATFNTMPVLSRAHADLGWSGAINACNAVPGDGFFNLPVEFAGAANPHWSLTLTGAECRRMSRHGIIGLIVHR